MTLPLPWLEAGQPFPPFDQTWGEESPAPGLLCAGNDLSVDTLKHAYANGIFPWYSAGQPPLWWCPDPRMVLHVNNFRVSSSLKKTIKKFSSSNANEIRIDSAFKDVIQACSTISRSGQSDTWILPEMINAYSNLHQAGLAHSVETWVDGQLIGGLYGVGIGHAVFGESMFHRSTDASKIALAALVALCHQHHIPQIDCQQNTRHLAALGAVEIPRLNFIRKVQSLAEMSAFEWKFAPSYWKNLDMLSSHNT
ncbi:MAG: leucyl/phenylalanyl-tRNA--protein transferase [Rhodoferax sp.]|nr:leucyl/phenylalanyl-tRNA--protein transferase [Betaproteobacteria bacterium]NCN97655.1 leucyl/phenylalanyl-tRNA--protein transferase [Rhodoferax sp.]OIP16777.1 MAG: leucyl/phenylalanyl-tRNA--protein transferase [Comamonadaceae bacterium CG2_30_57_122]PIZ23344.1 MAG: leucyl/phenylalanyl-tRNA--protein transferase [Comamonadaceae bacterium CG_4_10_14_0_8_um_filter_57_29]PJC13640.1 MAG: leucyl/phenylalanyl-tRNA--protein transferase [Comamonadaceae bacterium CG_4_9_14_0_8_um_filter_57_21]